MIGAWASNAGRFVSISLNLSYFDFSTKGLDAVGCGHVVENLAQMFGGHQRRGEQAVKLDDVILRVIEHDIAKPRAAVFGRRAQIGLGKVGMIKSENGRVKLRARTQRRPSEMVGIARLNDVGPDFIEHVEDLVGI